jgi:hypothetical protein
VTRPAWVSVQRVETSPKSGGETGPAADGTDLNDKKISLERKGLGAVLRRGYLFAFRVS